MLRDIHFHGELGEKYGRTFRLDVDSPSEAIRALITQIDGLEQDIRAGEWTCVRGDLDDGVDCDEVLLYLKFGKLTDFHVMPAAMGAKRGGLGKAILGIALIGITIFSAGAALGGLGGVGSAFATGGLKAVGAAAFGGASLFGVSAGSLALGVGAMLVLNGVAQMLTPMPEVPDYGQRNEVDQRPGYLFSGPINTTEQGVACPLVFGRIRAGSVVVSAGMDTERIATPAGTATSTTNVPPNPAKTPAGEVSTNGVKPFKIVIPIKI